MAGRRRGQYSEEFRAETVRMVRESGRSKAEIARELEISTETIRNWVKQADLDEGRRSDGLSTQEREEIARLGQENKTLRQEREILKKAAAFFAQETNGTR